MPSLAANPFGRKLKMASACAVRSMSPFKRPRRSALEKYEEELSSCSETSVSSISSASAASDNGNTESEHSDAGTCTDVEIDSDMDMESLCRLCDSELESPASKTEENTTVKEFNSKQPEKNGRRSKSKIPRSRSLSKRRGKSPPPKQRSKSPTKHPRRKKTKHTPPVNRVLDEAFLKPANTKYAHNSNRTAVNETPPSQKVAFGMNHVVCHFKVTQRLDSFQKKLTKAKGKFESTAKFPPGADGKEQQPKSILKK